MARHRISAKKVVTDIRAGMGDRELMAKHGVSAEGLRYICKRLMEAGLITDIEFYERTHLTDTEVFRAFSEEPQQVLNCPGCGSPLKDEEADCIYCTTITVTSKPKSESSRPATECGSL